jgi:hypothetical protein
LEIFTPKFHCWAGHKLRSTIEFERWLFPMYPSIAGFIISYLMSIDKIILNKPSIHFESITVMQCFVQLVTCVTSAQITPITIYSELYAHKISAVDICFRIYTVVMQCEPLLCFCILFGVLSSISSWQYILSKFSQPIRMK